MPPTLSDTPASPQCALTKAALRADHPTWCPGCGDFAVLNAFYRVLEKLQHPQESIVTVAGIGCSSRFPYFVNCHGTHFIHGRALALASGLSLSRGDLHVFAFGGDGDGFSIGGNHLTHTARKNIRMTYIIMDNSVYGLTKKQTSPTSPVGFKSKTDPWGAVDRPVNAVRKLIDAGATFVARTHAAQISHMTEMMERAARHDGFAAVEVLSECAEFYPGGYDFANPRKGGAFNTIELRRNDGTPEDLKRHDPADTSEAYRLAGLPAPGLFGVFYEDKSIPTKNALEAKIVARSREKLAGKSDLQILQDTLLRMR